MCENRVKQFVMACILLMGASTAVIGQEIDRVHWITFEQLEDSLKVHPKKVFIDFYADWCAPCMKMQKDVFTQPNVVEVLNSAYYAIQMNVECADTIYFGGQEFVNERIKRRNPVHQIPLLMATRKNKPFQLPAMLILDENFEATARYFQYLDAEQLTHILLEGK